MEPHSRKLKKKNPFTSTDLPSCACVSCLFWSVKCLMFFLCLYLFFFAIVCVFRGRDQSCSHFNYFFPIFLDSEPLPSVVVSITLLYFDLVDKVSRRLSYPSIIVPGLQRFPNPFWRITWPKHLTHIIFLLFVLIRFLLHSKFSISSYVFVRDRPF